MKNIISLLHFIVIKTKLEYKFLKLLRTGTKKEPIFNK